MYLAAAVPFEIKFTRPFLLQGFRLFVVNLLNNKTIILLNLAEYRLILADVRPRRLSIRRYSARFRRIIVKYQTLK